MKLKVIDACQWHGFEIRYGESRDPDYGMQFRSTFVLQFHSHPLINRCFANLASMMLKLIRDTQTKKKRATQIKERRQRRKSGLDTENGPALRLSSTAPGRPVPHKI